MAFECPTCGYRSGKWMGFCPQCQLAEPLVEEVVRGPRISGPAPQPVRLGEVDGSPTRRTSTGISELDRVLGGGMVEGSAILVGGEPGVGKSTLLLQMAGCLASAGGRVLIASGEESAHQVALRAERLGVPEDVLLLAEDDVDRIIAAAEAVRPAALVVDSIQSVAVSEISAGPGSVSQVRECATRLVRYAKDRGVATLLVGHVTKDGGLAGPKLLEHMVDVVLYLEGDPDRGFRALRSFKNRFGPTQVVALFDMRSEGMVEVRDPSEAFLSEWQSDVPGTIVFPAVEGRRAVMVEIQALTVPSQQPQPRRSVRGVDVSRVHQLLAVLERHGRLPLSSHEVYVNVVGGWRIDEPGCDLPVALALASSARDIPLGSTAAWGEVGLAGEVRAVANEGRRREEATRLGVGRIVAPPGPSARMVLADALAATGLQTRWNPIREPEEPWK